MHLRLAFIAALACSLVLGWATADAAPAQTLNGKTAQGYRIKLGVRGHTLKILNFKVELSCRDGSTLLLDEGGFLPTPVKRNGEFRDAQFGRTDTVRFKGRLRSGSVRGLLRVTDKLRNGVDCRSRWIGFVARRR